MLLKSNISESHLKLLNELLQGCSCIIDKPDLLQKICLKNVLKDVENSTSGSSINYGELHWYKAYFSIFLFLFHLHKLLKIEDTTLLNIVLRYILLMIYDFCYALSLITLVFYIQINSHFLYIIFKERQEILSDGF